MNTEERQLAEMLRRVAPEPPRQLTVDDVAFRLAVQAAGSGSRHHRKADAPRARRRGWAWAPVLAAASVIVVAGASAGVAEVLSSHHGPAPTGSVTTPASTPTDTHSATTTETPGPRGTEQATWPPQRISQGPWGAELINPDTFAEDSLVSGSGSLYAVSSGALDRIDPVTGNTLASVPYTSPVSGYPDRPVVTGNTVWVLSSYSGSNVALSGYDAKTLGSVGSVAVPVSGQLTGTPEGVLTSGSGGDLYVATGNSVTVVNPETRQVIRRISVPAGPLTSVATSPDGSRLYVSTATFDLLTYDPATGAKLGSSAMPGLASTAGNLVATSGGVWGTTGVGMTELAWFAPGADLTRLVRLGTGAGAGLDSIPTYSGGTVWIGGSRTLECASPVTGQVLASATIPTVNGVVGTAGSVTVTGGRTYAYYQNQLARQQGVATLTPPAVCSS